MKIYPLQLTICFLLITGLFSCEEDNLINSNLKNIDSSEGLYDFYLYDVNNNQTTRITTSPEIIESSYSISPDSKKVLFIDNNGINEMNIDGSEIRNIVAEGSNPCYSPNGEKIAYILEKQLFVINIDGSNNDQIGDSELGLWHPVWSRDGEYIMCSSDNGLCIISLDGSIETISSDYSADWYDWSNDSKEIYYSKFVLNNYAQIFKYDLIQEKETQITNINKYNYSPKCNPNTNTILFTSSHADYGGDLIVCDKDGLNSKTILHKDKITSPFWSPNGNKLVFVTEDSNIATTDQNGEDYRIINEIPGACMQPIWSPDGNYILYYRAIFYN